MHDGIILTPADAEATMGDLRREVSRIQRTIRLTIEGQLARLSGKSFETLEQNRELVEMIHELLESHGLRIRCEECGHPAILRISRRPGIEAGVFVLDHSIDGRRTFHGGKRVVPLLKLTAKPPRRRAAE